MYVCKVYSFMVGFKINNNLNFVTLACLTTQNWYA